MRVADLVLAAALAAHPNNFEPAEMSSEDIFAGVAMCMDKSLTEKPSAGEVVAIVMCSCLMDAQRANIRQKKPPEATKAQQAKCHNVAADRKSAKPGKGGT